MKNPETCVLLSSIYVALMGQIQTTSLFCEITVEDMVTCHTGHFAMTFLNSLSVSQDVGYN